MDDKQKNLKLMAYWLFGTVVIVFAAVTVYIALWGMPLGASIGQVLKAGFPVWGITAVLAVLFYVGYYFYVNRK